MTTAQTMLCSSFPPYVGWSLANLPPLRVCEPLKFLTCTLADEPRPCEAVRSIDRTFSRLTSVHVMRTAGSGCWSRPSQLPLPWSRLQPHSLPSLLWRLRRQVITEVHLPLSSRQLRAQHQEIQEFPEFSRVMTQGCFSWLMHACTLGHRLLETTAHTFAGPGVPLCPSKGLAGCGTMANGRTPAIGLNALQREAAVSGQNSISNTWVVKLEGTQRKEQTCKALLQLLCIWKSNCIRAS